MEEVTLVNDDNGKSGTFDVLEIFDAHHSRIFHYVLSRTGEVEVSRDITAEVFFKAYRNRRRFKPLTASISAWLFRIAGNEVSSFHRKKKYRPVRLDSALGERELLPLSLRGDLQEEILDAQERLNRNAAFFRVHAQLVRLPEKYQEVIVLHYLEEKTVPEIAEIIGKKRGTVKSLISRGIARLRKSVGEARDPSLEERLLAEIRQEKGVNVL